MPVQRKSMTILSCMLLIGWVAISGCQPQEANKSSSTADGPLISQSAAPAVTGGDRKYTAAHMSIHGYVEPAQVSPGSSTELTIVATAAKGWHTYAWAPSVPEFTISKPTLIVLDSQPLLQMGTPEPSSEVIEKFDDVLKVVTRFHKGSVSWKVPLKLSSNVVTGEYVLNGFVGFQVCADDDSTCDMPDGARFTVRLSVGDKPRSGQAALVFGPAKYAEIEAAASASAR